jgi:hypothetical protein
LPFNHQREYEAHVILGHPLAPRIWHSDQWAEVFPLLDSLAKSARGTPVTRSLQFAAVGNKPVAFGRIAWNRKGHNKWTHSCETPHRFLLVEVWAPSRGACAKDRQPPDLLFVVFNQRFFTTEAPTFRDTVILAVPAGDRSRVQACVSSATQIGKRIEARFHGRMVRPWARPCGQTPCGQIMFTDSLGDMPTTGLFHVGPVHTQTPGNDILQEHWEPG